MIRTNAARNGVGLLALLAFTIVAFAPCLAEEPRLYTNADLQNLPKTDLPPAAAAPAGDEPALAYEPPMLEARAAVLDEGAFLSRRRVEQLRARVDELEARLAAVHDPFLGRPTLSAEEQALWLHLDNVQQSRLVSGQIEDASAELAEAESVLARARGL